MFELNLQPGKLCLATLRRVSREPVHVSLDSSALPGIHASAAVVTKVIEQNRVVYGINTGFGLLPTPASRWSSWMNCSAP